MDTNQEIFYKLQDEIEQLKEQHPLLAEIYREGCVFVNAIDVHALTGSSYAYTRWLKLNIDRLGLKEELDYIDITLDPSSEANRREIAQGRMSKTFFRARAAILVLSSCGNTEVLKDMQKFNVHHRMILGSARGVWLDLMNMLFDLQNLPEQSEADEFDLALQRVKVGAAKLTIAFQEAMNKLTDGDQTKGEKA